MHSEREKYTARRLSLVFFRRIVGKLVSSPEDHCVPRLKKKFSNA